ncbi:MAG: YdbL family protein [Robiginitomaculum sp.]|nr:YdbL family protein [Robiginitomaculum sp.]
MKFSAKLISAAFAASIMVGTVALAPIWTPNAVAQTASAKTIVDQAKTRGIVGEKLNGYLGIVRTDASAEIRAAVNEINIKRKSIYTRLAREQKVGIADVAGLTGEKLIAKAKPGEMVMLGDGQWHVSGA